LIEAANPGDAAMNAIVGFLITLLSLIFNYLSYTAFAFAFLAAVILLGLALIWIARRWEPAYWILAGLVVLAGLSIPATDYAKIFPPSGAEPYETNLALTLFLIASVGIVTAALLLFISWRLYKERRSGEFGEMDASKTVRKPAIQPALVVLLGILILFKALHNVYWLTVWDKTTDPLGYLWLFFPIVVAVLSGVLLFAVLTGRLKAAGLGYAVLVPVALMVVSTSAQLVDLHMLTKARAEQVAQAIERYHARVGRYPQNLGQLHPGFVPPLPGPVIIFGQDWCYDGGENYYRLGYLDRQHWSDPRLIGRIHKTAGVLPDLGPICAQQAAALKARDPTYPSYTYWKEESD
jgi:MFS family permease